MPLNLLRYHGCGTGEPFSAAESRAIVAVRAASLSRGYSGVRLALLERLCALVQNDIVPVIPQEGSVGASGDLTPLSYVAAALVGEREVWKEGAQVPAAEALAAAGLEPLSLRAKEGLAVLNGTSVMTALACLAWDRARRLARLACATTAMVSDVLDGEPGHFTTASSSSSRTPASAVAARWIREILDRESDEGGGARSRTRIRSAVRRT